MKVQAITRTSRKTASKKSVKKTAGGSKARSAKRERVIVKEKRPGAKKGGTVSRKIIGKKAVTDTGKRTINQYVIPLGNGWIVKGDKSDVITAITDNKQQAITIARSIAKSNQSGMFVHNKSGKLVTSKSYNKDQRTIRASKAASLKGKRR